MEPYNIMEHRSRSIEEVNIKEFALVLCLGPEIMTFLSKRYQGLGIELHLVQGPQGIRMPATNTLGAFKQRARELKKFAALFASEVPHPIHN
jgi:protein-tyrosine-phosphatase